MIKQPYKNIKPEIVSVLDSLISREDSYHQNHKRRMARTLEVLLEANPKGNLLEIGTSQLIPLALRELDVDVNLTVTDFNLDLPSVDMMTCSLNDKSTDVNVVRVNIEDQPLPFPDNTFDTILLCEVLEHMERDPMAMLSEVNRILKDNGTLIVTTPNAVSTQSMHKLLHGYEPYFYMQYRHDGSLYRHNYEYSIHSLTAILTAAGFKGSIWTEDCFEDPIVSLPLMLEQLGFRQKNYGDNLIASVKKTSGVLDRYPKEIYVD
jgi:ubiquinone/menaquinone biosynthesis C-methylase UbiE